MGIINKKADHFKLCSQLEVGDKIALHYAAPCATVKSILKTEDEMLLVISVKKNEPVRYTQ